MKIMVGYSYVDNSQPSHKYHGANHNTQNQDQLYDLLMSKLLDGALNQPQQPPQDRVLRLWLFRTDCSLLKWTVSDPVFNPTFFDRIAENSAWIHKEIFFLSSYMFNFTNVDTVVGIFTKLNENRVLLPPAHLIMNKNITFHWTWAGKSVSVLVLQLIMIDYPASKSLHDRITPCL